MTDTTQALELCEIAEYDRAIELIDWPPDLSSDNPSLLFVWGVIVSAKGASEQTRGAQETAKELLNKAITLFDRESASLAKVYLALCHWRLGDNEGALSLLTDPASAQSAFCSLLVRAIIATEESDFEKALSLLDEAEPLVDDLSSIKKAKFHNHRGLALRSTADRDNSTELRDRAIVEFTAADYYFAECQATKLLPAVKGNLARLYSLTGAREQAHEYIAQAVSLCGSDRGMLARCLDQKAQIYLAENDFVRAEINCLAAICLLAQGEQKGQLAEALATLKNINSACSASKTMVMQSNPRTGSLARSSAMVSAERSQELAARIIRDNHELAAFLLTLISLIADPDGDPNRYSEADAAMQFLFVYTPKGEQDYRSHLEGLRALPVESESEFSS